MKETQNVTLALPKALLKRAKRLAAERETSVSSLLAEALARAVDDVDRYRAARRRHLSTLAKTTDLGTNGRRSWTRDDLHER